MKKNKNNIAFYEDFDLNDFPYKHVVLQNKKYIDALYEEFINSNKEPIFKLFLRQYFNEDQINDGFEQANEELPNLATVIPKTQFEKLIIKHQNDFNSHVINRTLSKEYFGHSLEQCKTIILLREIQKEFQKLLNYVLNPEIINTSYNEYADLISIQLISLSKEIKNPDLGFEILKLIQMDNQNIEIESRFMFNTNDMEEKLSLDNYHTLKLILNKNIREYLEKNEDEKNNLLRETDKIFLKDLFRLKDKYSNIISLLKEHNYVLMEDGVLEFVAHKTAENGIKVKRLISCLGYVLDSKNYLKSDISNTDIAKGLTNTFRLGISKMTYKNARESFLNNNTKAQEYISMYHFIPKLDK